MSFDDPSPNHDARPPGSVIDMLVLHYTGMRTATAARDRLCDPAARVSAHYLVDEDGTVMRLVPEVRRAWHAGVARWRGNSDINARSIGIELVNPGHDFGYRPFPDAQMAAVAALASDIVRRHGIPARNMVGHSDVAPTRKQDPGELFDWPGLAAQGIGLWPAEANDCPMDAAVITAMLDEIGYDVSDPSAALKAFQRHFRPVRVTGRVDAETVRRLAGLLGLCRNDGA
ncbi:MAG: N-acetylmuramoyl-L-alanine amidase [Rhodospirillales bacterium]|nr:MAG: N-acetylmuramoyl-L-alanine amidase [Rhodospirillales bacterium]